ncbi:MAG: hypothetical protein BWY71_02225 [Planctomycetes bacterium ADurb.Bin412]|nr:MAG: hypothetical protein BWY71_02225 [Planctomycetes bacterium ADurb.Bin412]
MFHTGPYEQYQSQAQGNDECGQPENPNGGGYLAEVGIIAGRLVRLDGPVSGWG